MNGAIMENVSPARAAIALLAAGHTDAAADVLLACDRSGADAVTLTAEGAELRITVGAP